MRSGDMVREVQRKRVLSEIVSIGIRDFNDPVPNAVEPKFVVESAIQCLGRMGYLEDSEWRAGADNRGHLPCTRRFPASF